MRVLTILIKSLVRTFYEANVGFFLVVLYLAFGLMSGTEHVALATSIATSLPLTILTIILWFFYWVKGFGFVVNTINRPSYKFIRQISLIKKNRQFALLFCVFALIGAPVWGYAVFIAAFNITYQTFTLLALMIGFLLIANTVLSVIIMQSLAGSMKDPKLGLWHKYISKRITLPYNLWFIRHLFVKEPMLIFLSKAGSLIIILGSIYLFKTDIYDWRLIAIGSLFGLMINSMLIYQSFEFTVKNYWVFNLPLKGKQIVISTITSTLFLFIPEILLMLIKMPSEFSALNTLGLLLMNVSLAYFILGTLIITPIAKEDYGKRIFYMLIGMVFLIMFSIPLLIIEFLLALFGIYVFNKFYQVMLKSE